jgi:hypothetical protein
VLTRFLSSSSSSAHQHELDHLDGVLITDIALPQGIISREVYDGDPRSFQQLFDIDYCIEPTI